MADIIKWVFVMELSQSRFKVYLLTITQKTLTKNLAKIIFLLDYCSRVYCIFFSFFGTLPNESAIFYKFKVVYFDIKGKNFDSKGTVINRGKSY